MQADLFMLYIVYEEVSGELTPLQTAAPGLSNQTGCEMSPVWGIVNTVRITISLSTCTLVASVTQQYRYPSLSSVTGEEMYWL